MFGEVLNIIKSRKGQGMWRAKFMGKWGCKLVDVNAVNLESISNDVLKSQKTIWFKVGSNKRIVRLLATYFDFQLMTPVFVTEFCKSTLKQLYEDYVAPNVTARNMHQIAEGITYLHGKKIIHANLHPETIMISESKNIKISEFQLAKTFGDKKINNYWKSNSRPEYLDFEANAFAIYGKSNDMFALGCIFFEILVGKMFMEFPVEVIGSLTANAFYADILKNRGLSNVDNANIKYLNGRATCLSKRLQELGGSAINEYHDEQIELIESLVLKTGSQRITADILLYNRFWGLLSKKYNISDCESWMPDLEETCTFNCPVLVSNDSINQAQARSKQMFDFEAIFDCNSSMHFAKPANDSFILSAPRKSQTNLVTENLEDKWKQTRQLPQIEGVHDQGSRQSQTTSNDGNTPNIRASSSNNSSTSRFTEGITLTNYLINEEGDLSKNMTTQSPNLHQTKALGNKTPKKGNGQSREVRRSTTSCSTLDKQETMPTIRSQDTNHIGSEDQVNLHTPPSSLDNMSPKLSCISKLGRGTKRPGRPSGSFIAYPEIQILQSGAFQCIICSIIFQDRTKSLRHRTNYLKNKRCKST